VLGPHLPTLTADDLELIHRLWLQAVGPVGLGLHHRDVVRAALEEFSQRLSGEGREQVLERIREQARKGQPAGAA
jgi:hypothetical protein